MEPNRPDEERAAAPQEQQQDIPLVAEEVTSPTGAGTEDSEDASSFISEEEGRHLYEETYGAAAPGGEDVTTSPAGAEGEAPSDVRVTDIWEGPWTDAPTDTPQDSVPGDEPSEWPTDPGAGEPIPITGIVPGEIWQYPDGTISSVGPGTEDPTDTPQDSVPGEEDPEPDIIGGWDDDSPEF